MAKRRFEFVGGGSSKFWEVEVAGKQLTITFGKLGATGQTQVKKLGDAAGAKREADKLIAQKLKKGYAEAKAGAATVPRTKTKAQALAEIAPLLAKHTLPYIELVAKPTKKPLPLWASKGCDGRPYLPKDVKWPIAARNKRTLLPVLQIDFADVPALPGFPKTGLLSLWWTEDHQDTKIFYFPKILRDESKLHADFSQVDGASLYPYLKPVKLAFAKRTGSVPYGDYRFKDIFGKAWCDALWDSPHESVLWTHIWKRSGGANSRLGGYASPQQNDPREAKAGRKYETQLLQLQNDNFTHNFFITPAALKRRDFSDVLDYSACD